MSGLRFDPDNFATVVVSVYPEPPVTDDWVHVPAHRVLRITHEQFKRDFAYYGRDDPIRLRRKVDGKLFRTPRWHRWEEDMGRLLYLEEMPVPKATDATESEPSPRPCGICKQPVLDGRCRCV
jgi:hypothetical protein